MEAPSEGVGGDQNVQPSADEIKKAKRRARDRKYLDGKKQKVEDTKRQLERIKEEHAELQKSHAYLKGQLDQLIKDLEHTRETNRRLVEGNIIMSNMIQQFLQNYDQGSTPFNTEPQNFGQESTSFNTEENLWQELADLKFNPDDLLHFDNEDTQE